MSGCPHKPYNLRTSALLSEENTNSLVKTFTHQEHMVNVYPCQVIVKGVAFSPVFIGYGSVASMNKTCQYDTLGNYKI